MDSQRGSILTLVLITFLIIAVIGVGVLSLVMSDLHGTAAHTLAMQAMSTAEAGLNYGAARLVARASLAQPTDERYIGEEADIAILGHDGRPQGKFLVTVTCVYPAEATPPACDDDVRTPAIDERDLRRIISSGFVPGRPGRARRQVEAIVRRYAIGSGDVAPYGVCGRDPVELGPETVITADVGSNGDVAIVGPQRPGSVRGRLPRAPQSAPTVVGVAPMNLGPGLTGTYTWRVTTVDSGGRESGGGPPTRPVFLAGQHAQLVNIPPIDPPAARRRAYRSLRNAPRGPWFLVGEIADGNARDYTDYLPDEGLRLPMPGDIRGSITAAGTVFCSGGCAQQVEGPVQSGVRKVVCPNFLPPPSQPGTEPAADPLIQTAGHQTMQWTSLHVGENAGFTIETLSTPDAELHVHLTDIRLERAATLAVTGLGAVYFHITGAFTLGPGAVFGAVDFSGHLVAPADRIQVYTHARDPAFTDTGVASIRWDAQSKVSALVFAPNANVVADQLSAFRGALYGKHIRISGSSGIVLDPVEGLGSQRSAVRPSPYQYILRWYDNPNPVP